MSTTEVRPDPKVGGKKGTGKGKPAAAAPQKMGGLAAAVDVLEKEGGPLHVRVIATRVLEQYETGLKGATPTATVAAQLHVAAKKGDRVVKVARGTFGLIGRDAVQS